MKINITINSKGIQMETGISSELVKKYYIENVEPKLLSILDKGFDETEIKSPEVSYL